MVIIQKLTLRKDIDLFKK